MVYQDGAIEAKCLGENFASKYESKVKWKCFSKFESTLKLLKTNKTRIQFFFAILKL